MPRDVSSGVDEGNRGDVCTRSRGQNRQKHLEKWRVTERATWRGNARSDDDETSYESYRSPRRELMARLEFHEIFACG